MINKDIYEKYKKKFCPRWCPYFNYDCREQCEIENEQIDFSLLDKVKE